MKRLLIHAAIGCCALVGGERIQPVGAQVLLPYGTNVARVIGLELNLASLFKSEDAPSDS